MDDGIDEIEFPTSVCSDREAGKVHGPHRIDGTWRERCPGVTTPEAQRVAGEAPAHVRDNCPALPVGCVRCTAPDTVRKALIGERKLGDVTTAEWRAVAGLPEQVVDRDSFDQWIAEQLAGLTEAELLRVKAKLDEIAAAGIARCVHGFVTDGGIETCPNGCRKQPIGGTKAERPVIDPLRADDEPEIGTTVNTPTEGYPPPAPARRYQPVFAEAAGDDQGAFLIVAGVKILAYRTGGIVNVSIDGGEADNVVRGDNGAILFAVHTLAPGRYSQRAGAPPNLLA